MNDREQNAGRSRTVKVGEVRIGGKNPLVMVAGPCVIESREMCLDLARALRRLSRRLDIPFIFKASYDKANRTSLRSYRGPGLAEGLEILSEVRERVGVPVVTDVHSEQEVPAAARAVDMIQIPAFLCRQTDLLMAAGESGCAVNVKKGQFMAPWDMAHVVEKVRSSGNRRILLTERGASFGYNALVADMRSLPILRRTGCPVVFDCTHSVQAPGGAGSATGGDRRWAPVLARGAVAGGFCDAVFMETHRRPEQALSDAANSIPLNELSRLWRQLKVIRDALAAVR
ncbi:3-deoxy-8-phosphooctulonate synthase [Kiritimatiella glycovorans]|uniref:2-dehydro-3-deoxyphosphooctonate aldolase n=1 Tax=Kiritimatiella glycovorans TaxID=1307763 RepID=A0A0G3EF44_9BACT|nr:3-deoxy-8-phosphooctulonate synthase [Kiritimatiella glycovorans]AKJ64052.1 2-dehydro-3-deoxyphosphooctonate aldolase [Kiritimatiella glycovorans]